MYTQRKTIRHFDPSFELTPSDETLWKEDFESMKTKRNKDASAPDGSNDGSHNDSNDSLPVSEGIEENNIIIDESDLCRQVVKVYRDREDGARHSKVQGDSEGERKRAEDSFTAPAVSTASNEYLHITAPIAETEGFAMEIGSLANPGRQSQSILEVLENGYYLGKPVTKVRLTLLSGRRHQLRLHTKFIGYPIVGDVAYTGDSDAERMMLHAFQLTIPLTKGKELARGRLAFLPDEIKAESPDPFVFTDGNLS